ncbi:hypothetical protein ACS0TY_007272 [Phlomoides rotata]
MPHQQGYTTLLGKIGWRLITDATTLVCQILKARYFPHCLFLEAKLGRSHSFTWSGIHKTQGLLRKGVRWIVESGQDIQVWGCLWLNDDTNFYVETPLITGFDNMLVSDLFSHDTRYWDKDLIEVAFTE